MELLIMLALVMALLGVLGYQRGTKAAAVVALFTLGGLLLIAVAGATIASYINAANKAVHVAPAAMKALAGEGEADALSRALADTKNVKPIIPSNGSGPGFVIVLGVLVGIGFLVGHMPKLRGKASLWGMLWGLASGYLFGGFMALKLELGSVVPPLPFGLAAAATVRTGAWTAAPSGAGFLERLARYLHGASGSAGVPIAIAIVIAVFVIVATRSGSSK